MKSIIRLAAVLTLAAASTSAMAHAKLQTSVPSNAAVVGPPTEVRLQYNEAVEAAVSTVRVFGPDNAEVATGKVVDDKDDLKSLVLPLPTLAPGEYRAEWATAGVPLLWAGRQRQ